MNSEVQTLMSEYKQIKNKSSKEAKAIRAKLRSKGLSVRTMEGQEVEEPVEAA